MEVVVRKKDKRIVHINGARHGGMHGARYDRYAIPDQEIPAGWFWDDALVAELYWPDDVVVDKALLCQQIDKDVHRTIEQEIGIGEHFIILREQISQMLADSDKQPTKRFQALTDIAEVETTKGRKKKDALKEF